MMMSYCNADVILLQYYYYLMLVRGTSIGISDSEMAENFSKIWKNMKLNNIAVAFHSRKLSNKIKAVGCRLLVWLQVNHHNLQHTHFAEFPIPYASEHAAYLFQDFQDIN